MQRLIKLSSQPGYLNEKQLLQAGLIIAIAIAVCLRILYLENREFWYDEVLSLILATGQRGAYETPGADPVALQDYASLLQVSSRSSFLEGLKSVLKGVLSDPHPPLSYVGLYGWLHLFGNSQVAVRSLVALTSLAAIASAYGLGRWLFGWRGGLLFAALLATNPFYLGHSLNLRMYCALVLWTIVSAWAALQVTTPIRAASPTAQTKFWSLILMISVAAGLLTQYLFVYWVATLAVLMLYRDRAHWWSHGVRLGLGILLTVPWAWWGTRQQIRNASYVVNQISEPLSATEAMLRHGQDLTQTLGNQLVLGEWATSAPAAIATMIGVLVLLGLIGLIYQLWQRGNRDTLAILFILGLFPLLLAMAVDITTGKFAVGFGWGRAMIFALPGCLLLLVFGLEQLVQRWYALVAAGLLAIYLTISTADLTLRHRQVFHAIADLIPPDPTTPTLVVMNSQAWGHVLRLAYYLPASPNLMLLAQKSVNLAPALEVALNKSRSPYPQIMLLEAARPVWSPASTDAEKQQIRTVLERQYQLTQTQTLTGTMLLDEFVATLYTHTQPENS